MKNKEPKHLLILKIIAFLLAGCGIALIIAGATTYVGSMGSSGWFEAESTKNGLIFGGIACLMFSVFMFVVGFSPAIAKAKTKTAKYIQEQNKEDLTDIVSGTADIASDAITKATKAIKNGLNDSKFCKHCGEKIDTDSKFCRHCGKEQ